LRPYIKDLEQDPSDLIGKGENDDSEVDEGYLLFDWKPREKKYRMLK